MSFFEEFKTFAMKGNALDMAVGIIVGAGFNKIVQSIVNDLIMPPIGMMIGGVDFKYLKVVLKELQPAVDGKPEVAEVAIRYGMFLNTVFEFMIVAFTVFCMVKFMNRLLKAREKKD